MLSGDWRLLRLATPLAREARPGHWLAGEVDQEPLRGAVVGGASDGSWLALLLPPSVTAAASANRPLNEAQLDGTALPTRTERPAVLIGEDAGIGAILYLAELLEPMPRLVLLGARTALPFRPQPSQILVPDLPAPVIGAVPRLERDGIPSRIADPDAAPGCYPGTVVELFGTWLANQSGDEPLEVIAAGPFGIDRRLRAAAGERTLTLRSGIVPG